MQIYKPGQAYACTFSVLNDSGNLVDADSLPTATANKNGTDDAGFVLTVANLGTGRYKVTGTVPLTYSDDDRVDIFGAATVSGGAKGGVVDRFTVASHDFSDFALEATAQAILAASRGSGDTAVDHDTGGTDNLRYVNASGDGIDNAQIKCYLKTDWDSGNIGESYVKAQSMTDVNGRWVRPVYLDVGNTYTIACYVQGVYEVATAEVTI